MRLTACLTSAWISKRFQARFFFKAETDESHLRSRWPRGRVLGGSSVLNYMLYVRGNKKDYDNWERLGAKGWSWKNVLPYFLKSEDNRDPPLVESGYHATGGYLTVSTPPYATPLAKNYIEAGLAIGYPNIDINGPKQGGIF
ncbi:glucose dehydrogenase [Trichonephila clavipes]|nr:glucose dehydrogenase [Trichonephila clavipes]